MFGWFSSGKSRADEDALVALKTEVVELILDGIKTGTAKTFAAVKLPGTYMERIKDCNYGWTISGKRHLATFVYSEYRGMTLMGRVTCRVMFKGDRFVKAHVDLYARNPWDDADIMRNALEAWKEHQPMREVVHVESSAELAVAI